MKIKYLPLDMLYVLALFLVDVFWLKLNFNQYFVILALLIAANIIGFYQGRNWK